MASGSYFDYDRFRKLYNKHRRAQGKDSISILITAIKQRNNCIDCGSNDNLTFDHIDRSTKCFNLANAREHSFYKVTRELIKCEIVCRKCHDVRESRRDAKAMGYLIESKII